MTAQTDLEVIADAYMLKDRARMVVVLRDGDIPDNQKISFNKREMSFSAFKVNYGVIQTYKTIQECEASNQIVHFTYPIVKIDKKI